MSNFSWGLTQLSKLLPLDEDTLKQIIEHSFTLPAEAAAENFKNLLGDSPQVLEFISSFNRRRATPAQQTSAPETSVEVLAAPRNKKKKKASYNQLPEVRRPDDYGNTEGAYHKKGTAEDYMPGKQGRRDGVSNTHALSSTPAARQLPTTNTMLDPFMPNVHSRTASPSKLSRSSTPGPVSRTASPSTNASRTSSPKPKRAAKATIQGGAAMHGASSALDDLESAIRSLEMSTNPTISLPDPALRHCPCMGTLHPILAAAPNCLSCGKIVCIREGLAPCTFCNAPLLTPEQVQEMVRSLREERGREKMAVNNAGQRRAEVSAILKPFQSVSSAQKGSQATDALESAQAHRDRLLGFQATNAARTRVIDEAASYETPDSGVSQWGSAEQRAAQLKKQQRILRDMEWNARPEYEKRRVVISVDLVGGKVVKRMADVEKPHEPDFEDKASFADEEALGGADEMRDNSNGGAFSRNPLLGKLTRPTWKPESDTESEVEVGKSKAKGSEGNKRERSQLWRRVQDDAEDNEDYILNGGIYGGREKEMVITEEPACG